ncbi:MAG TPA: helix-turn-helix domain-containing protein [Trebonia sp.]|nr:helix-turn-helix domain-containing protein [Trebonia sp.]
MTRRLPAWPVIGQDGGAAGPAAADPDAVRLIVGRFSRQLEPTAERMVGCYCDAIPDYRLADADFLDRDVYAVSLDALRVTVGDLEQGRQGVADEFGAVRAGAARRVHQDVSLESFLRAVRLWGKVLWGCVLDSAQADAAAEREAALTIAGRILEHIDIVSVAAAQGYLEELQTVWSDREVIRRDLLDALISGDGDSERVRRLARSLRLRLSQNYIVLVVRSAQRRPQEFAHSLPWPAGPRDVMEAVRARLLPASGALLMGVRHGELVVLYPFDDPAGLGRVRRQCSSLAGVLESADARIGISSCHLGLGRLAAGYAEAREAAEIAAGTDGHGRVVAFEDVLIDSVIRASSHAERILESTIRPLLAYDAEHKAELVATLRSYVQAGFNLTRCAESRSVHPNTIVYRLRRIRELTGRDPHVPDDLLLLQLGLKLAGPGPAE